MNDEDREGIEGAEELQDEVVEGNGQVAKDATKPDAESNDAPKDQAETKDPDQDEDHEEKGEPIAFRKAIPRMVKVYGTILGIAWDIARGRALAFLIAISILGLTGAVQGLVGKFVIDGIEVGQAQTAINWGIVMIAVIVASAITQDALGLIQFDLGDRISYEVDRRVLDISAGSPGLGHLENPKFKDRIRLVQEHTYVPFAALTNVNSLAYVLFGLLAALVLLWTIHPLLLLMPIVAIPSGYIQFRSMRKHMHRFDEIAPEDRLSKHYMELATEIKNAKEIRIFGISRELEDRYKRVTDEYTSTLSRDRLKRAWVGVASGLIYGLTMAAAIGFIGWLALNGRATAGDVFLGVLITRQAIGHVEMAAGMIGWLAELSFVGERYLWMLEYQPDVKVVSPDIAVPPPLAITTGIDFKDVSFTYPDTDKQVLEDINLHLPAGGTIALVGENGAGKSTIVKLLARFYDPTEGSIDVDGIKLTEMNPEDWREVMAASFQDFVRFQLIASEAVGVGDLPHIDESDRIAEAARFAGADRIVDRLPEKMKTQLGREFPEGTDLSEGEWQRIALARGAMRREPVLVCLDEPTASLDARAEHEVFEKFAQMSASGETFKPVTLLVSHRFSTVRMADMIVVIAGGKITEVGSHEELIANGEAYAELFSMQASRYN